MTSGKVRLFNRENLVNFSILREQRVDYRILRSLARYERLETTHRTGIVWYGIGRNNFVVYYQVDKE